jgi:PIN domain nuclease of toxin-antitoxin system
MGYILDTHTFIWFINGEILSTNLIARIKNLDNRCYTSIASLWEIGIKTTLGKLSLQSDFSDIKDFLFANNIDILPITFEHIQGLINLPHHHNDPFDRLIIAQGITEDLVILTKDQKFSLYNAAIYWDQ